MTVAPPAPAASGSLAPLQLPWDLRLTPEQFELVCRDNPEAVLELASDGQLIAMTPTGGDTGSRNSNLIIQLGLSIRGHALPLKLFDSSTGFRLPDGSVLSPDAALVRLDRWKALLPEQRRGFPPLCPDLVVELASPSDDGPRGVSALRRKMELYRLNGAQLGWLLLPAEQSVEIWRGAVVSAANDTTSPPESLHPALQLDAGPLFPGLSIELAEIWQG